MRKIEAITELPDWDWNEQSSREMLLSDPEELLAQSLSIWQVGQCVVAGFVYTNYLRPPWMWFVIAKNVTVGDLVDFRRVCKLIPSGTLTAVEEGYERGIRFAELYEFEDTGLRHYHNDFAYRIYRRK